MCAERARRRHPHRRGARPRVSDYAGAIDALVEVGALPGKFAATFRSVAGFRNILVHGYLAVDIEIVHQVLNGRLGEFTEFAEHVEGFLGRR